MLPNQLAVVGRIIRVLANNEKMDICLFIDVYSDKKKQTKQKHIKEGRLISPTVCLVQMKR